MNTEEAIRSRHTIKLKADPEKPLPVTENPELISRLNEIIELAGTAPFHYVSADHHREGTDRLKGEEPWRFYAFDSANCRKLLSYLNEDKPLKSSEGIKQMLAAADALVLVTWLPEKNKAGGKKYYPNIKNTEHIAATGAAIQNFLVGATASGLYNYWSSGGCLRKNKAFRFLNIPEEQILLGALFIFPDPENTDAEVEIKYGKNRMNRSHPEKWKRWVEVN